ncbi:unnamed protein product [Phaedon cochleariae]|uniref:COMM domain-containing protein n=1 Tax=Phaedon cochleariae TaxID=80249 RepID=A0A9N9X3G3_PHACE|nr:unnamed protein product [Phaedon cochleariae]
MLISLRSDHKLHLQILMLQPIQVIIDFCKLAMDFLQNGPNMKRYHTAAQKLEVEVEIVQNCVYGLINLLLMSSQHKLSDADFRDSVLTLGFSQEQQSILSKFYESKQKEIQELMKVPVNEPHYDNLKWRFEAQVTLIDYPYHVPIRDCELHKQANILQKNTLTIKQKNLQVEYNYAFRANLKNRDTIEL